jgi:hypothetical protein
MYSPGGECLEDAAKLCEAWPLVDELLDVMDGDSAYGELNSDVDAAYKRLRAELAK